MTPFSLVATAGTNNPCLIVLRAKGYQLQVIRSKNHDGTERIYYSASLAQAKFLASSGPELLGLVTLWETLGENWNQQTPDIIDEVWVEEDNDDGQG